MSGDDLFRSGSSGDDLVSSGRPGGGRAERAAAWLRLRLPRLARARPGWTGRARLAAAAVVLLAASVTVPLLAGQAAAPGRPRAVRAQEAAAQPAPDYPGAIVARLPLPDVDAMVQAGRQLWATTGTLTGSSQLIRIDPRTGRVVLRVRLRDAGHLPGLLYGSGRLWVVAYPPGHPSLRLLQVRPATGKITRQIVAPAGCWSATYGLAHLWLVCGAAYSSRIVRMNPATGRVDTSSGALPYQDVQLSVGAQGAWFSSETAVAQVAPSGQWLTGLILGRAALHAALGSPSLAFGGGALWALSYSESIARINPGTGRVTDIISKGRFDPRYQFLDDIVMTTGQRSLWLLAPADRNQLVRVDMRTGAARGEVTVGGSCGQPCDQLYDAAGSVWIPDGRQLIRIDPRRIPARGGTR